MTEIQRERNREFIKDLRANQRKAFGRMRGTTGGRCCLCVALDTAVRLGFPPPKDHLKAADSVVVPPVEMAEFYGWQQCNPVVGGYHLSVHNDGGACGAPKSHKEIADLLEEHLPEITA